MANTRLGKAAILGALLLGGVPISAQQMVTASKAGNVVLVCNTPQVRGNYNSIAHPSIWSLNPLRRRCALQGHSRQWTQRSAAFSPDGRLIAFACLDNSTVEIFNARTGKLRTRLRHVPDYPYTHAIGSVAFSPDGQTLAVGTAQRLFLWEWRRKRLLSTSRIRYRIEIEGQLRGAPQDVTPGFLQFSPDGRTLAFQGWDLMPVFLFDVRHRRVRRVLPINSEDGHALALRFSHDGHRLLVTSFYAASASYFDQVFLFDTHNGNLLWHRDNYYYSRMAAIFYRLAAFSSDDRLVAVASDERLEVRDARDGHLVLVREFKIQGRDPSTRPLPSLELQKRLLPDLAVR